MQGVAAQLLLLWVLCVCADSLAPRRCTLPVPGVCCVGGISAACARAHSSACCACVSTCDRLLAAPANSTAPDPLTERSLHRLSHLPPLCVCVCLSAYVQQARRV